VVVYNSSYKQSVICIENKGERNREGEREKENDLTSGTLVANPKFGHDFSLFITK
jgi:hypothetical protein